MDIVINMPCSTIKLTEDKLVAGNKQIYSDKKSKSVEGKETAKEVEKGEIAEALLPDLKTVPISGSQEVDFYRKYHFEYTKYLLELQKTTGPRKGAEEKLALSQHKDKIKKEKTAVKRDKSIKTVTKDTDKKRLSDKSKIKECLKEPYTKEKALIDKTLPNAEKPTVPAAPEVRMYLSLA